MVRPSSLLAQLALLSAPITALAAPSEPEGNEAPLCVDSFDVTIGHTDRQVLVYADDLCTDPDGDRLVIDSVQDERGDVPVRGRHFSHLRLDPNIGTGTFTITSRDTWQAAPPITVTVTRENAAPSCPEELMVREGDTLDFGSMGFTDADGDAISVDAYYVTDGNGGLLSASDAPEGSLPLPATRSYLDEFGLALARVRVDVSDELGAATTCRFPIDPPDDVVCNARLERTQYDPSRPLVLDPADDCVSLDGNDDRFAIASITSEDGVPVEWYSDRAGNPTVLVEPGQHTLAVQTSGAGTLAYEVYVNDALPLYAGKTAVISEDGGDIALAPLVKAVQQQTGNPDDPTTWDPLEPVKVELIGPDLSTIAAADGGEVLSTGIFSTSNQGVQTVGPKLLLTLRNPKGELISRSFDVPVNLAPRCRATGPAPRRSDGTMFVPDSWCMDPEGSALETVSVRIGDGEEVGFEQVDGGLLVFAPNYVPPYGFTLATRDEFGALARATDDNKDPILYGEFTIVMRDDF